MARWIEYPDRFEVRLHERLVNLKSVSTDGGLTITFGQPPSKRGSYRYKLKAVSFDKPLWNLEEARQWWGLYCVRFVHKKRLGTKLPQVAFWLDEVDGVYTFVCHRHTPKRHPAAYWVRSTGESAASRPGRRLGVYINPEVPRVTALVMDEEGEVLASREWLLHEEIGILVHCSCGDEECPLQHQEIMPAPPGQIESQLRSEVESFARQFGISEIYYGTGDPNQPSPLPALALGGKWLDEGTVSLARAAWLARRAGGRDE